MMKKKRSVFDVKLDPEEQELLETVDNFEKETAFTKEATANFIRKQLLV